MSSQFLGIVYGIHIVLVIYLITYFAVKGHFGKGSFSFFLVVLKYLIYWKLVTFGFKYLPAQGILIGFTGGLYLSLPILYLVNKRMNKATQDDAIHGDANHGGENDGDTNHEDMSDGDATHRDAIPGDDASRRDSN